MTDYIWTAKYSADPSDAANWYPDRLPAAGDKVTMATNVMYLSGNTLNGTDFHLGYGGTSVAPFGPVLNIADETNLKVTVEGQPGDGNAVTINTSGHNTIDLYAAHPWYDLSKVTTTVNVGENSFLEGTLNLGGSKFTMTGAGHSVFANNGTSYLTHANQDVVHITPDILGTGEWKMVFSNLEVGGYVGPGQDFQLIGSDSLVVDHAAQFKGTVNFLPEAGSTLTFKDVFSNDYSYNGSTVTFHEAGKVPVSVNVKTDFYDNLHIQATSAGTELWVTHVIN